jgi:hypothetical protein
MPSLCRDFVDENFRYAPVLPENAWQFCRLPLRPEALRSIFEHLWKQYLYNIPCLAVW